MIHTEPVDIKYWVVTFPIPQSNKENFDLEEAFRAAELMIRATGQSPVGRFTHTFDPYPFDFIDPYVRIVTRVVNVPNIYLQVPEEIKYIYLRTDDESDWVNPYSLH